MLKSMRSCLIVMSLLVSGVSHGALIDRGGGLIYDDVLDVTWLQDTRHWVTSGYSTAPQLTFAEALAFAEGLEYHDRVRNVTWSDWRLPSVAPDAVAGYDPSGASSERRAFPKLLWSLSSGTCRSSLTVKCADASRFAGIACDCTHQRYQASGGEALPAASMARSSGLKAVSLGSAKPVPPSAIARAGAKAGFSGPCSRMRS